MKKLLSILVLIAVFTLVSCGQSDPFEYEEEDPIVECPLTYEVGVRIGNTVWATRNVGETGKFHYPGKVFDSGFFEWNNNTSFSQFDHAYNDTGWMEEIPYRQWSMEQDPCPEGWRIPTTHEFEELFRFIRYFEVEDGIPRGVFRDNDRNLHMTAIGTVTREGFVSWWSFIDGVWNNATMHFWVSNRLEVPDDVFDTHANAARIGFHQSLGGELFKNQTLVIVGSLPSQRLNVRCVRDI